jgi:hypothetical protein
VLVAVLGASGLACAPAPSAGATTAAVFNPTAPPAAIGLRVGGVFAGRFDSAKLVDKSIVLKRGIGGTSVLDKWINDSLQGKAPHQSAALLMASADDRIMTALQLDDASLTEVLFPALGRASDDAALLTLTITPASIRELHARDELLPPDETVEQKWAMNNFRLEIGDLPCEHVSAIDAFAFKPAKRPDSASDPATADLRVTVPDADASAWEEWLARSVAANGKTHNPNEKQGKLTLYGDTGDEVNLVMRRLIAGSFTSGPGGITVNISLGATALSVVSR